MSSVDVYVPCYNYARFLPDAVHSVLSQEGVTVRVLILDDASSDDSEAVGRRLAAADPRVEYRRHETNHGHIATYNEGIDWLAGDYCLLLSADDMLLPGALARAAAVMDAHSDVVITHGQAIETQHPDSLAHPLVAGPEVTIQTGSDFIRSRCVAGHNLVACSTAIGRSRCQKLIGHYRRELPHSGDMEMWLRFAEHGSIAYLHAHQALYRRHDGNMSHGYRGARDLWQIKLAFDSFFDHAARPLPDAAELRHVVAASLERHAFEHAYQAFVEGDTAAFADIKRFVRAVAPRCRYTARWLGLHMKQRIGIRAVNRAKKYREWIRRTTRGVHHGAKT